MEVVDFRETITHKQSKQVHPAFFMPSLKLFRFHRPFLSFWSSTRQIPLTIINIEGGERIMKTVNCFELYPSILDAKIVQNLLLEIFPNMHTALHDDTLEMYITKEEYVFVLNELSKLNNYSVTIPDDIEESVTLTSMPIEMAIVERYGVLYDLMFEAEYVSKEVGDDVVTSDRELGGSYSNYILGKKFSPVYNIEEDYQDYLVRNCKEK